MTVLNKNPARMFRLKLFFLTVLSVTVTRAVPGQVNVLTYHNDNARTGDNLNETILTPANVNQSTFGKIFTYNVDGNVYAQPLYVSGVNIPGQGVHNVVFVATENNTVYALDGDSNTGSNGGVLWHVNFGPAAPTPTPFPGLDFTPIVPEVGITSTPVIDPVSGLMYVDAFTQVGTNFFHTIHALSITNGVEASFSPVTNTASVPGVGNGSVGGVQNFQARQELQRSALTLANGILYVAYAGYTDITGYTDPFHGWVIGFNASNLQQLSGYVFNSTPNGTTSQFGSIAGEGGIWGGGAGLAVDPSNSLYFATGDGDFTAFNGSGGTEYGDTFLKLSTTNGLSVVDYFTPTNQAFYRTNDLDVGSGGVMLLPDQPGAVAHMMTGAGKPGTAYLINRDQMTAGNDHFDTSGHDAVLASVQLAGGCYGTPAYFNGTIFYAAWFDHLVGYVVSDATIPTIPNQVGMSRIFGFPGATPCVSANGTNNGIVWGLEHSPTVLFACNATNITTEIYNSTQAGTRDQLTNGVTYAVPTIVNGKVYVGGPSNLAVFGLLGGALQFSSPNYTVQEDAGTATITVDRIGGSQGAVQVNYATTAGGTATAGQEYTSTSGTLSWTSGDSSAKTFKVTILDNDEAETNHTIFLTLSSATGGASLDISSNAVLTILEDPYDLWKFDEFGANANNPAIAGNLADPAGDGIANILKYAVGLNPNVADTNPLVLGSIVSNHFQLQFDRNTFATDLSYAAEATASLTGPWSNLLTYSAGGGWVTNTPGSTVTESAPAGSPPNQPVGVTITDPVNTTSPGATNRFFRLQVQ